MFDLTPVQREVLAHRGKAFLFGSAGTGKSTILRQRLVHLLQSGEVTYSLLIMVAEPEHVSEFIDTLHSARIGPYSDLLITTYTNFARRMVTLFWPLIARSAGFSRPHFPPTYLNYDLAQILMGKILQPMIDQGAFAGLVLRKQAITSQVLDTLNRAAFNGLSLDQANEKQMTSWAGSDQKRLTLADAAEAAQRFRERCLQKNLLDLSLVVRVFDQKLVNNPYFSSYFRERYRHLIVDNLEEQTPAGQRFISELLGNIDTASIAFDRNGGYKRFLSADPEGAYRLRDLCTKQFHFKENLTSTDDLGHLANHVENKLLFSKLPSRGAGDAVRSLTFSESRGEMVAAVVNELTLLTTSGVAPGEIALIAPYLDNILRYTLSIQLEDAGIPFRFLRRRAAPRDEPRVKAWLTWLALGHPGWSLRVTEYDVAEALALSIDDLDPIRAHLITQSLLSSNPKSLRPVSQLPPGVVERVGRHQIDLIEEIRLWLDANGNDRYSPDIFLHRLFHELLGRRRFQADPDLKGAAVCDWLVRSARRLRQAALPLGLETAAEVGAVFVDSINHGLVSSLSPDRNRPNENDQVTIATIYSYLLVGKPVRCQFWLDVAATGWWDIPRQPLSNAFVLNPGWRTGEPWTMENDIQIRSTLLSRIVHGLTNRCREEVIITSSELDRRGFRQDGPLGRALQVFIE